MISHLICCILLFCADAYATSHEKGLLAIQDQTFLVYRRYYFIARLDKTIKLLAKFSQEAHTPFTRAPQHNFIARIMATPEMQQLKHTIVKNSIISMSETRSLKPLFMVWDTFKSYKSLKDDLFVEDFSKEIFIITRAIAQDMYAYDSIKSLNVDADIVARCDTISWLTEYIEQYQCGNIPDTSARVADISDLSLSVQTDEVAYRYYLVHRLHDAIAIIKKLSKQQQQMLHELILNITGRAGRYTLFGKRTMLQMWDDCLQYKHINDPHFVHTLAVELSLVLHIQQHEKAIPKTRTMNYTQLMHVYQQINKIPLEEVLNGIDFMVSNAYAISENYQKSGLTFTQWIKEYWWAPPLVIATMLFQCAKFYYKKYYPR